MLITASTDNISVGGDWERPDPTDLQSLGLFPVALIADSQSRLGVINPSIRLQTPGLRLVGAVFPILVREGDNLAIHRAMDAVTPHDVLVINAGGDTTRACFGGLLGEAAKASGVTGVVIDGAVRDVDELAHLQFPVFAKGVSPAGPFKHGPGTVGDPVACGGVVCQPGDAIVGDSDGIVVVQRQKIKHLLEAVSVQEATEKTIRDRIRAMDPSKRT